MYHDRIQLSSLQIFHVESFMSTRLVFLETSNLRELLDKRATLSPEMRKIGYKIQ